MRVQVLYIHVLCSVTEPVKLTDLCIIDPGCLVLEHKSAKLDLLAVTDTLRNRFNRFVSGKIHPVSFRSIVSELKR